KELWRIRQADIRMPKLEDIRDIKIGEDRQILINGKRFRRASSCAYPATGLLSHHKKNCKPDLETYLKATQEQFGFNTVGCWNWRGNRWDDKLEEYETKAVADLIEWFDFLRGLNFYGTALFDESTERGRKLPRLQWIKALAEGIKDHPAFFSYTLDEPEIPKYSPEHMTECYKLMKSIDPVHLVHVNLCNPAKFKEYANCSDWATLDVYPFPGMSLMENDKRMKKLLDAFPKSAPTFTYLQMFNFNDLPMPSFDQVRGTFIFDRILGSHSLVSYAWGERRKSFLTDMELQAYFRAIYAMYMKIEDAYDAGKRVEWPVTSSTPDVRAGAIRSDKETVVMAVNLSKEAAATVSFPTTAKRVSDFMDDAWTYPIENGQFKTSLQPNGILLLRLK
ncbi:MAG: hypothetical protein J5833_04705, partial [Victivallales bacterium]|nr:hypothetical protein [Victivallales bacterium]